MAGNPITYAEGVLGVHSVWTEAESRLTAHGSAVLHRADLLALLRGNRADQADREATLLAEVTGKYAEQSDTARNRILKTVVHDDDAHRRLREGERELQAALDDVEANISHHEKGLSVLSARMVELGGLLTFYAAAAAKK